MLLIPQFTLADLAIKPLLPKGNIPISDQSSAVDNLPILDIVGAPYDMKTGGKRAYVDVRSHNGTLDQGSDTAFDSNGLNLAAGFDYKFSSGYASIGVAQEWNRLESTESEVATKGYEDNYTDVNRDLAFEYIHELNDTINLGVLILNRTRERTRKESVAGGFVLDSGRNSDSGTVTFSFTEYVLFSRIKMDKEFSAGFLFVPASDQEEKYDSDYSKQKRSMGHGNYLDAALGYQTKKLAAEVLIHVETEQARTIDPKVLGIQLSGEYLLLKNLSVAGKVYQYKAATLRYDATDYEETDHQSIQIGANYQSGSGTYSIDFRDSSDISDDNKLKLQHIQVSAIFSF